MSAILIIQSKLTHHLKQIQPLIQLNLKNLLDLRLLSQNLQ